MAIVLPIIFLLLVLLIIQGVLRVMQRWEGFVISSESILQTKLLIAGGFLWFMLFDTVEEPVPLVHNISVLVNSSLLAVIKTLFMGCLLGSLFILLTVGIMLVPFVLIHQKLSMLYETEHFKQPYYMYTTYLLFSNVIISAVFLLVLIIRHP